MKIAILAPIATRDIGPLLDDASGLPDGYPGAPLVVTLIRELLRRGHQVVAATIDIRAGLPKDSPAVAGGPGLTYYVCPGRRRAYRLNGWRPGRILDLYREERRELSRVLAREQPDVVHAHWSYEFGWAAADSGLPHVVTCHDSPWQVLRHMPSAYRLGRMLMARHVLSRAQRLTTVSDYMREELARFSGAVTEVVPNPIDLVEDADARALAPGAGTSLPLRIGSVLNGWSGRKNGSTGLLAFDQVRRRLPRAELHLFGEGYGAGGTAQRWAQRRRCDAGISFHGPVAHSRLLEEMRRFDLLLHPSREESFGMAIVEAQMLGIPVIGGRRSGAVPWLLGHGKSGALTDIDSKDAIAECICSLASSPGRYQEFSRVGRDSARQRFSTDAVATSYERIYRELALRGPRSNPVAPRLTVPSLRT